MAQSYKPKNPGLFREIQEAMRITPADIAEILAWGKGEITADYDNRTGKLLFKAMDKYGNIECGYFGDYIAKYPSGFKIISKKAWEETYERVNSGTSNF